MSRLPEKALEAMDAKPGRTIRCRLKSEEAAVRVFHLDENDLAPESINLHIPDPTPGRIIRAKSGPSLLPGHLDLKDRAPE